MKCIFVIFNCVNCALNDALKLFNRFGEAEVEANAYKNAQYSFLNGFLFQVRRGKSRN